MNSVWNDGARRDLRARLARLTPATPARWGTFDAPRAVAHLVEAARMAHGDVQIPSVKLPLRFYPIKKLVLYVLPFPKGAPTAPELLTRVPGTWAGDVAALDALIERWGTRTPDEAMPDHPAFGRLTYQDWGVLVYRHTDHHLRQFGV